MNPHTETRLIAQFQDGDRECFVDLFYAFERRVRHIAMKMLRNEDLAFDVMQEVFVRAYEELPRWRGEARLSTWLYRTTLNVCYERLRCEERQRKIKERQGPLVCEYSPENRVHAREALEAIARAVKRLPPQQRTIFVLKQYQELRFGEIAKKLAITEGGAKASYHKALLSLRGMLKSWAPRMEESALSA